MNAISRRLRFIRTTQRYASTIPTYSFSRRDLIPFIRRIHPDLYQAEKPEVRDGNLRCIQDLYEIFDFLNAMQTSISGTTLTQSSAMPNRINPLPASYAFAFACHSGKVSEQAESDYNGGAIAEPEFNVAHAKSPPVQSTQMKTNPLNQSQQSQQSKQPKPQLQHIKLKITPPKVFSSLSAGTQLSSTQKQSAVHALQRELSGLFALVGVEVPWSGFAGGGNADADEKRGGVGKQKGTVEDLDDLWASLATYTPSNTTAGGANAAAGKGGKASPYSAADRAYAKRLGFDMTALDERAFDRHVQDMHRLHRAQALIRSGTMQQGTASSSGSGSNNNSRRISRLALVEAEVDYFFQSGRVLLRSVPLNDEMDAIRRLKSFLTENNGPLHFSCERWAGVTMVMVHKRLSASPNGQAAKLAKNDPSQYTFRLASEYIAARAVASASANVTEDDDVDLASMSSVVPLGTPEEDAAGKRNDVVLEFPWDFRPGLLMDVCCRLPAVSALSFDGKVRL